MEARGLNLPRKTTQQPLHVDLKWSKLYIPWRPWLSSCQYVQGRIAKLLIAMALPVTFGNFWGLATKPVKQSDSSTHATLLPHGCLFQSSTVATPPVILQQTVSQTLKPLQSGICWW